MADRLSEKERHRVEHTRWLTKGNEDSTLGELVAIIDRLAPAEGGTDGK